MAEGSHEVPYSLHSNTHWVLGADLEPRHKCTVYTDYLCQLGWLYALSIVDFRQLVDGDVEILNFRHNGTIK